ncbi:MAG: GAF domain-containing sensor histidine kinase [Anaerolineales bacterium]|nr:GAF domain-containing sensor histidine kinase [Anaerolineales bacterium]
MTDRFSSSTSDSTIIRNLPRLLHRYARLLEVATDLASTLELETLLNTIVQAAREITDCEAASLLLYDPQSNHLYFEAATNMNPSNLGPTAVPIEGSIAGWVFSNNKPLLVADAFSDTRFFREVDVITNTQTRNIIGVPLHTKDKTLGVIEGINKESEAFDQEDLRILQALASQAAIAIENSRLFQQSDLIAEMVHELRTPLASLTAASHLLTRPELPEEQLEKVGTIIFNEVQRLNELTTDFLNLSQLESGRVHFIREPVHLEGLVLECIEIVRPQAQDERVTIHTAFTQSISPVQGDRNRLKQVLLNLLTNAIKYNHIGGTVTVNLKVRGEYFHLEVKDTGIGISEESMKHLFTRFYRSPESAGSIPGTGLGLVIVKRIVEGHGGRMEVQSEAGKGSTFTISLPKQRQTSQTQ